MTINIKSTEPIFIQFKDEIQKLIISGYLKPGEKLLSVRELSIKYKINPNTVQKSLQLLEDSCLIFTDRTNGKYVTNDIKLIKKCKNDYIYSKIDAFWGDLQPLNVDFDEIAKIIKEKGGKNE